MEEVMFADSLLESAPHPGHRAAWTKLLSTLLQSTALAIALAIPLFHIERLQIIPPTPSIRMTSVSQPVMRAESTMSSNTAPAISTEIVQPRFIPRNIAHTDEHADGAVAPPGSIPCTANCSAGLSPLGNILDRGGISPVNPPLPPTRPVRVSEMQLGDLLRKVIPQYPTIAKQLRVQGSVVLMATVGKDGRVEHVQPVSGPPLLVGSAKEAVEQWQYRPYLLNHEPVVVQTQITVNFVLNKE
jgi:periplasmic protein TonB